MKKVFSDPAGKAGFQVAKRKINAPVNEIKTAGEYTVGIELRQAQKNEQAEGDSHVQLRNVYECIRKRS